FIHAAVVTASAPPPPATSTLSLHDALPILEHQIAGACAGHLYRFACTEQTVGRKWQLGAGLAIGILHQTIVTERRRSACVAPVGDRKSTRLNSSHVSISYAVFCLKKKKKTK